jgi:mono/diheme cytochrome c family protein
MPHGEEVFTANCSMCHGANGQGQGSFPALANNPDVIASVPVTITQFVVHGSSGQHNFGDKLSDLDIAAVLTYIRGSWGNKALPVSELDVQAVRQNPVIKPTP